MDSDTSDYISVYKKLFGNRKITLDYSGILVVQSGEYIDSDNFGYSSLYSQYILITIQKDSIVKQKTIDKNDFIKFKIVQFETYKKSENYKNDVDEYFKNWQLEKESELSKNNTKRMSKSEIEELKKQYQSIPTIDYIDNFFFVIKDIDYIIVDY